QRTDYRALRRQQDKIRADASQYQDPESEIADIERERKLILATIKGLEDKYILNFFTDAGLLPNYAFPETGVRLRAVITGLDAPEDDDKRYLVQEYVRPAPLAIRELAPFNTFYTQGRRVQVSHVNLLEREDVIERWQFCDRCSHIAPVSASHYHPACPACGSTMWNDVGQQHDVLRFRQASSLAEHWGS
ncbi:MAG: hypothetical protein GY824_20965, partial [Delftia sp.]|nr:hypothetical protein [Delftia sp.]